MTVNLAATNSVADHKHRVSVSVVSPAISVFFGGAAKLRHRQDHNVVHALSEVGVKSRDGVAELLQQIAKLALTVSFVDVRVPIQTRCVRESYFQPDAGLDQLRNL